MESAKINAREKIYMVHRSKNKFWEIWNQGCSNIVRYGKLKLSEETKVISGSSDFESTEEALSRALALIILKLQNGYTIKKTLQNVQNRFTSILQNKTNSQRQVIIDLEPPSKTPASLSSPEDGLNYLAIYSSSASLEEVLNSLSLSQYLPAFYDEGISLSEFYQLTAADLERLYIPPSARRKILKLLSLQ
ncbi:unnamed protein product [Blepharisma stoltei]|uniref:SAM domain-containing protein n=1 Tax=Blepharisma stoltei TaxID=1481888 RepID=A0AAU9IVF5_9CILI|nr:unnamed protein product [Blepharisma stoltei]